VIILFFQAAKSIGWIRNIYLGSVSALSVVVSEKGGKLCEINFRGGLTGEWVESAPPALEF
jgi:hypothetical protein